MARRDRIGGAPARKVRARPEGFGPQLVEQLVTELREFRGIRVDRGAVTEMHSASHRNAFPGVSRASWAVA